jgi:hypothetical protein
VQGPELKKIPSTKKKKKKYTAKNNENEKRIIR